MNLKPFIILTWLLTVVPVLVFAQAGMTPDNAAIGGAGAPTSVANYYKANFFDGTVDINIPIYGFPKENVEYGVGLSYNTRGVLVDEVSGITGEHWNLRTGPSIQRVVKDIPDELNYSHLSDDGDSIYIPPDFMKALYNPNRYVKGKLAVYGQTAGEAAIPNTYRDGEMDDFIVNLNDRSFTFNIGSDGTFFTIPQQDVKIELLINDVVVTKVTTMPFATTSVPNMKFTIRDELGNKFFFEPEEYQDRKLYDNAYWDYIDDFPLAPSQQINSWAVTKAVLADGSEINYTYDSYISRSHVSYMSYTVDDRIASASFNSYGTSNYTGYIRPLLGIAYPNGVDLEFNYNTSFKSESGEPMITSIDISERNNCMKYMLQYDPSTTRRYLQKIFLMDCAANKSEQVYQFAYNYQNVFPNRLNGGKDFFGYYNRDSIGTAIGASGNKINIPKHLAGTGITNYGTGRIPNSEYAEYGLLSYLTTPTNATVFFVYGGHSAIKVKEGAAPTNMYYLGADYVGGVRVDSIVEYNPSNGDYKYTQISYSNGQIFTPGGFFDMPQYVDSTSGGVVTRRVTNNYLTKFSLINGSNVGYSNVMVKEFNNDGQMLSRRDISYTNILDASISTPRYYRFPGSGDYTAFPYSNKQYIKDWEIGLPLQTTYYDHNNRIVSSVINTYTFSGITTASTAFQNVRKIKVNTGTMTSVSGSTMPSYYPNKRIFTDTYRPFRGGALLSMVVSNTYHSDANFVPDTVWYTYDSKANLKTVKRKNSFGEYPTSQMVYNYDVDGPSSAYVKFPGTALYQMTADGIQRLVATENWEGPTFSTSKLVSAYMTGYIYDGTKTWIKSSHTLATELPMPYADYATGYSAHRYMRIIEASNGTAPIRNYQTNSRVTLYDADGYALEMQQLDKDMYYATIWDAEASHKIAEAANCKYKDIAYCSFEDGWSILPNRTAGNIRYDGNRVVGGGLTGRYHYQLTAATASDITGEQALTAGKEYLLSFWYLGGSPPKVSVGTTTLSAPSPSATKGSWKQYIYKFTPSVAAAFKITNSPSSTGFLDELRLHPSDARMQSSTYEALHGTKSFTDESGRIIYFEYDPLGNIEVTRDQDGNILEKWKYKLDFTY